jgi:hypothetical protein
MAKARDSGRKKPGSRRSKIVQVGGWAAMFGAVADIFTTLVEKIGLVGAVFFTGLWFVQINATAEQKRQIIGMYVLGERIGDVYPTMVLALAFAAVVLGQHYIYKRKLKIKSTEIDRLSEWKTEHQQGRINAPLHHSDR